MTKPKPIKSNSLKVEMFAEKLAQLMMEFGCYNVEELPKFIIDGKVYKIHLSIYLTQGCKVLEMSRIIHEIIKITDDKVEVRAI